MNGSNCRPYATGGIVVGASVRAVSPIAPPRPDIDLLNEHELQAAACGCTAKVGIPSAAGQTAFNTASGDASTLTKSLPLAGVGLQKAIVR